MYSIIWQDGLGYGLRSLKSSKEKIIDLRSIEYELVLNDIERFWRAEQKYRDNDVLYRRGILMHGPPGCGKSFLIKRLARTIINEHKGIVLMAADPDFLKEALQLIRAIEPDIPVLVIHEDFDDNISGWGS